MAWTSVGFDGTITEIQWAGLAGLLGNGYVAAGNGDCLVTAVGGARQVSVAAGSLYGDGVLSTNSGAETVALTTPTNGQWYVIALRRTWATNTAALVAIAGATTSTSTPTAPPTSFPVLNTNVGVLTDQPIAWAWCNSANTTVVVYDIRLKAVKSMPPVVANAAERDAKFMSPYQGLQVWRDDLGAVETYYGLYNVSSNPGGRDTASWYMEDRQTGLVPIKPGGVTFVGGTGSVNALGQITFNNCTGVLVNNCFSAGYKNYRIVFEGYKGGTTGNHTVIMRMASGGTTNIATSYEAGAIGWQVNDGAGQQLGGGSVTYFYFNRAYDANVPFATTMDIITPYTTNYTRITGTAIGRTSGQGQNIILNGMHWVGSSFDGIGLEITGSNFNGSFTIYGYND